MSQKNSLTHIHEQDSNVIQVCHKLGDLLPQEVLDPSIEDELADCAHDLYYS